MRLEGLSEAASDDAVRNAPELPVECWQEILTWYGAFFAAVGRGGTLDDVREVCRVRLVCRLFRDTLDALAMQFNGAWPAHFGLPGTIKVPVESTPYPFSAYALWATVEHFKRLKAAKDEPARRRQGAWTVLQSLSGDQCVIL